MSERDLEEAVARAIAEATDRAEPWSVMSKWRRDRFRDMARAAIKAVESYRLPAARLDNEIGPKDEDMGGWG